MAASGPSLRGLLDGLSFGLGVSLSRFGGEFEFSTGWMKKARSGELPLLEAHTEAGGEDPEPVPHASTDRDVARFRTVDRRARDFGDRESEMDDLSEHLVVEDDIVRVFFEWKRFENLARERAVSGVVFAELVPHDDVLEERQRAVGESLEAMREAVRQAPDQANYHASHARIALRAEGRAEARQALRRAVEIAPAMRELLESELRALLDESPELD